MKTLFPILLVLCLLGTACKKIGGEYNTNCGKDTANYWAQSQGTGAKYKVLSVKGIGIGNYPIY